jgi:hypothetical protein
MAVAVFARFTGVTPERYDEIVAALHLDIDPPAGAILRLATESPEGVVTCEVWQTAEAFHAFVQQRLRPVLLRRRVREEPSVRIVPLHDLYAPDLETIERIGSASRVGS